MSSKLAGLAALTLVSLGTAQAEGGILDLGTLGGPRSWAQGVSADGSVVVGVAHAIGLDPITMDAPLQAFRWTQTGGMTGLGTLGGHYSWAYDVSADGSVVVGESAIADQFPHAFRWTQAGGMADLGTLGGRYSYAFGVSANGSAVVGMSNVVGDAAFRAFRWTQTDGMIDLGTLGGTNSFAYGASADGSVVVGGASIAGDVESHAFRWTQAGGMIDLDPLGNRDSGARDVSADGSVVVGYVTIGMSNRAFRWTQAGGMVDLGTLGGTHSHAYGVSADGTVVVGDSNIANNASKRAFRWTQATGMQSVEDWLRASGVLVPNDITWVANATNSDGSVVVGLLANLHAFIARAGSGLITLADAQQSLGGNVLGGGMALSAAGTVLNGAHSRPLSRRVAADKKAVWLAGDWGHDDHGARNGNLGLAEVGGGLHLGPGQFNIALGKTWANQDLTLNGRARTEGAYLMAEMLVPVSGNLWATFGGYGHRGDADLRRGYLNAGVQDYSTGTPDVNTRGLRARLDWDNAWRAAGTELSPYADLTYSVARLAGYAETGGGFPARFNARKDKATELRMGVYASRPLSGDARLVGTLEAAHRLEGSGGRTSGQVIGLFGFDLPGQNYRRNWLRVGFGVEGRLGGGTGSLMVNATTRGEAQNAWLAAGWQMAF